MKTANPQFANQALVAAHEPFPGCHGRLARPCLGPSATRRALAFAAWALLALLTFAATARAQSPSDWAMERHDPSRSSVTDQPLAMPLALRWRCEPAQPPAPAWPEPGKNLNRTDFDYAPHPIVAGGKLFWSSSADDTLRAHDAATGEPLWQFTADGPLRFAPQFADGALYLGSDDGRVHCLNPANGKPLWTFTGGPRPEMILGNGRMISRWPIRTGVLVDRGVVYFAAGMWPAEGVFLWALDAATGKVIWCNDTAGAGDVRVVGHVIEPSLSGITPQGAIAATADRLVVPMGRGAPATFDRATGKLLKFHPGDTNGFGGTWLTLDGDMCFAYAASFYSGLAINGVPIETMENVKGPQVLKPLQMSGFGMPRIGSFVGSWGFTQYDAKVKAIVKDNRLTARAAYGLLRAKETLVLGYDGSVAAEGTQSQPAATIRVAVAGNDLAIHAVVVDHRVSRDAEKPWKGSCFELFAASAAAASTRAAQTQAGDINLPASGIAQLMMIPAVAGAAGDAPAAAFLPTKGKPKPADDVRIVTTPTADGYDLAALVPLATLGLAPDAKAIDLEFQVTGVSDAGKLNRDTLFGSPLAYQDRSKFGQFRVGGENAGGADKSALTLAKLPAIADAKAIAAALATIAPHEIRVAEQRELWRAPVRGKAYELAVADGRLYAVTDAGQISCFASAPAVAPGTSAPGNAAPAVAPKLIAAPITRATATLVDPTPLAAGLIKQIADAKLDVGYALVVGTHESLSLARALAERTQLDVVLALPDAKAVAAARDYFLNQTALYGSRVHVLAVDRLDALPFPRWFASVVYLAGNVKADRGCLAECYRVLRPAGGLMVLGTTPRDAAPRLLAEAGVPANEIDAAGPAAKVVRGRLAGALDWDTKETNDKLVRWPLRPIWFGGTGPAKTHNRKYQAPTLATANGRFIENGQTHVTAVDAYNGAEWWSVRKPVEAVGGHFGSSINADDRFAYFTVAPYTNPGEKRRFWGCIALDARSGKQQAIYAPKWSAPPSFTLDKPKTWAIEPIPFADAAWNPKLNQAGGEAGLDTSAGNRVTVARDEKGLVVTLVARPAAPATREEWLVGFDLRPPGQRLGLCQGVCWTYRVSLKRDVPGAAPTVLPAVGEGHPALAASGKVEGGASTITLRLAWADVPSLANKPPAPPASLGFAAVVDFFKGPAVDLAVSRGSNLAERFQQDTAEALNAGWPNLVLDPAATKDLAERPTILAGGLAGVENDGADLGEPLPLAKWQMQNRVTPGFAAAQGLRTHPLTGEQVEKIWIHGDGCSAATYADAGILSRAANAGFYDFVDDSGLRSFGGVRQSCGSSVMAAQGVWYMANGGSGCECTYAFLSQVALAPADRRSHEDWAQFADWRADTQVRQAALNFGAPGDRRDEAGVLWLGVPRASGHRSATYGIYGWAPYHGVWQQPAPSVLPVDLAIETFPAAGPNAGPFRVNADRVEIAGTDKPWIYASQVRAIRKATLKVDFYPALAARPAGGPVALDGKLDEPAWKAKPQVRLAMSQSSVAFAYDDENLYIAGQRDAAVDRKGEARNWNGLASAVSGDAWEVYLTDASQQKVIHLATNCAGARSTALVSGPGPEKAGVTLAWQSAVVARNGEPFVAEFAIPWATLSQQGIDKSTLRVNAQVGDHPLVSEAMVRLGGYGRSRCQNFVPLGLGTPPAKAARRFTLRLHFAELEDLAPGKRVFDVLVQGKPALERFDAAATAGGPRRAVMRELKGIEASESLTLEFVPRGEGKDALPFLSAMELQEETPVAAK
ncbi:MAG: PQQ-binding-like beta-propeller repeat protein [Planctomycetota bacterium]|nr:PQQ-binding-like beta-propeller repeat protein [Planctomycetota bacterium]